MLTHRPQCVRAGKSASGLKEVTDSFAEGMAEGDTGISKTGGENAIKAVAEVESVNLEKEKEKAD